MITKESMKRYEDAVMKEIVTRRGLGGYSPEAGTILQLCEITLEMLRHIKETSPSMGERPEKRK